MSMSFNKEVIPSGHTSTLRICASDAAPEQMTSTAGIISAVTLITDLSSVPRNCFKTRVNSKGIQYYHLDFEYGLYLEAGGLKFDMKVDGKVYGSVKAKFE
ncbi:Hypothetical protein D9617_41g062550 [Elsinoe fawcettii]|nr:Hypothetical protein D9617_41g062550 [Elsinoe fawcettii]